MAWNRHQRRAQYRATVPRAQRITVRHDNRIYGPIRIQAREAARAAKIAEAQANGQ